VASGRGEAPVASETPSRKRRLPGVNVRPGSVKQARLESGLSLAQLGKGHVTAPAIYLIETGRTRPSLPTLEHIARRTGKPVEFFLAEPGGVADDTQTRLVELEALVADGRNPEAIALGRALLDHSSSAHRLGRIRFLLGQAHLASSEPERAAGLLEDARAHFAAVNDGVMLAECLGALATVATVTHAKDAVALAEGALALCRKLKPVPAPTEARLLGILADACVESLDWDGAIRAYEEAIEVGRGVSHVRDVARQYASLGAAFRDSGEVETAARYTVRSVALLELFRDRDLLAKSEHSLGMVHVKRGDLTAARRHLERALELCSEFDLGCGRGVVLLGLAELALHQHEVENAHELATEALELAERLEEGTTIAEAHAALGRIAGLQGRAAESDRQFEDAILGFEALGQRERLLHTHGVYAEVLERRGELARAYSHMKEALQASRPGLLRGDHAEERVTSA
jgi:tetratricopeptide (TPR) repeat protein/DNA-binding XRE family transcriptional regulator